MFFKLRDIAQSNRLIFSVLATFGINSKHTAQSLAFALKIVDNPALHHGNAQIHGGKKEGGMTRPSHMLASEAE